MRAVASACCGVVELLGLLDQGEHVAHAEDAAGHAVGVEDVEVLELLAGGREHDRLAGHFTDRQRRTTAGIAVELGEHDTGEADAVAERLGGGDGVLADHGVEDEQGLVRVARRRGYPRPGAISSASMPRRPAVSTMTMSYCFCVASAIPAGRPRRDRRADTPSAFSPPPIRRARMRREHGCARALTDDLQLGDGARPLQVTRDEQGRVSLTLEPFRELSRQRGLTGTLQTGEHDHRRRGLGEAAAGGFRRRGCRPVPR